MLRKIQSSLYSVTSSYSDTFFFAARGPSLSDQWFLFSLKVMFHETIRNDDFSRNTVLQYCCDIVSNGYNTVPALQRCVALKIVVAHRPVYHHLKEEFQQLRPTSTTLPPETINWAILSS